VGFNKRFDEVEVGSRLLYRPKYASRIVEDAIVERSPSGDFVKFKNMGWVSRSELVHYELLEVLEGGEEAEGEMCPNCVTPWKCNGPHVHKPCRNAPGGSRELERYFDSIKKTDRCRP